MTKSCSADGCARDAIRREWCNKHYLRWLKYGDPERLLVGVLTPAERFWAKVDRSAECWIWRGGLGTTGYGQFTVERRTHKSHRMAWALTHGAVPDGLHVCHRCDNRLCVNPSHLFLGTRQDNMDDMVAKGRSPAGERNWNAKLTEQDVLEIRRGLAAGTHQHRLAQQFAVSQATISGIACNRAWRLIKAAPNTPPPDASSI